MTPEEIAQLKAEATRLHKEGQDKLNEYRGKAMPADVEQTVDRLFEAATKKLEEATREEKAARLNTQLGTVDETKRLSADFEIKGGAGERNPGNGAGTSPADDLHVKAFNKLLVAGEKSLTAEEQHVFEQKALQTNIDPQGGFLVAPQQFVAVLIKFLDDETFVRELATKFQVPNAQSLGAPSLDNDPSDADWTSEVGTVNTDELNNMFGKRELRPYDLTKEVKISKKLLQQAQMDPASFVAQRIAYKFGVTQEKAFLIGSGSNQPLGIYTPSADGIDTSRDVIAAAAAVLDGDDFIDTKMSLKGQYHKRAVWTLHREVLKRVMKLQSSQGEYLYQDLRGATPDTILGLPYKLSEFSPSDVSTGKYVAALGDFSYYWIADAMNFAIQVLTELYARTRQNGYIATASVDGQPVLAEAFARLKMA